MIRTFPAHAHSKGHGAGDGTLQFTSARSARAARRIENRLVKLIDGGENLADHYRAPRVALPYAAPAGTAVVLDGLLQPIATVCVPSAGFDRYARAKNADVFTGLDGSTVVALRNAQSKHLPARMFPMNRA